MSEPANAKGFKQSSIKDQILREGIATPETLNEVLREAEKRKEPFLDYFIRTGKFDEKKLLQLFVREYGYTAVNPAVFVADEKVLELVPRKMLSQFCILPLSRHENTLTVAFANPTNVSVLQELAAVTRMRIKVAVAEAGILKRCIQRLTEKDPAGGALSPASPGVESSEQNLDDLVKMIETEQPDQPAQDLLRIAHETPVIKIVNMVLLESIRRKASDIFVEPWENHVRVRARVDGLLEEVIRPPKALGPALVSRIKVMSELNIAEHRIPQDGRFKIKMAEKEVDMRVSILPTTFGEKVCLRILDTSGQSHDISKLGFDEREQTIIRDCARKPHGMILVTGPTGSGKTTTLYSVLKYLDSPEVNITTVEDPVEYQLAGINQVNVKEHLGLTFPAALRSILRQDPDIILIGEIRDNTTLDIAVKAALTGHLVLSTLHTNDAASSVTRMMNMGLEPFLISSTVLMISAQRLVRRLCTRCRQPADPERALLEELGVKQGEARFYSPKGCGQCRQSGYKGRTVITEILSITPEIREMIMKGAPAEAIKNFAHSQGMTTLRECALRKALQGETTLEEVMRVTSEDQGLKRRPAAGESEAAA